MRQSTVILGFIAFVALLNILVIIGNIIAGNLTAIASAINVLICCAGWAVSQFTIRDLDDSR